MDALVRGTSWHSERRQMYDRVVDVPVARALPRLAVMFRPIWANT